MHGFMICTTEKNSNLPEMPDRNLPEMPDGISGKSKDAAGSILGGRRRNRRSKFWH